LFGVVFIDKQWCGSRVLDGSWISLTTKLQQEIWHLDFWNCWYVCCTPRIIIIIIIIIMDTAVYKNVVYCFSKWGNHITTHFRSLFFEVRRQHFCKRLYLYLKVHLQVSKRIVFWSVWDCLAMWTSQRQRRVRSRYCYPVT
jgi:hypothetical protein